MELEGYLAARLVTKGHMLYSSVNGVSFARKYCGGVKLRSIYDFLANAIAQQEYSIKVNEVILGMCLAT